MAEAIYDRVSFLSRVLLAVSANGGDAADMAGSTPRLALRYSKAIPVLMTACGIELAARPAFEARIRQMQRLGVPKRESVAAGRLEYGLPELAALATAVRLMACFMVPSLAARYVSETWIMMAPALLAGAKPALSNDYLSRRPLGGETILIVKASALDDLGKQGRHDERYAGALSDVVVTNKSNLTAALANMGGSALVLDTSSFMPTLVVNFAEAALASGQELAHELDRLRFQT